jgi:probable rRNA maturation factor
MKKEMVLTSKGLDINFFYDDRSLVKAELSRTKKWLGFGLKALEGFLFRQELKTVTKDKSIKKYVLNISLCGEYKIRSLNKNYRQKDKVTDVLSFPLQDDLRNGMVDSFMPEIELGDLYICKQVCQRQAKQFQLSYEEEFVHLMAHGFLHLCGYDHEIDEKEEKLMFGLEEELMKKISQIKKGS